MKLGQILIEESIVPTACLVSSMSSDSAQLSVMTTRGVPSEFVLCCSGSFHNCFVRRRERDRLLVGFNPSRRARIPAYARLPLRSFWRPF